MFCFFHADKVNSQMCVTFKSGDKTGENARKSKYIIEREGNAISCETNRLASYDSRYIITIGMHVAPDAVGQNVIGIAFDIISYASENLARIARSLKGFNKGVVAVYKLSNGGVYTLESQGEDNTSKDFKKSDIISAIGFFSLFTQNNIANPTMVAKFRSYDIESVNIGDGVIDFKNTLGIKTAPIIDEICRELEKSGVDAKSLGETDALPLYSDSSNSTTIQSQSTLSSSSTNKTSLTLSAMLSKPMGCINSNLIKDSYNSIKNNILPVFKAEADGLSITISKSQNNNCDDISYHGLSFDYFTLFDFPSSRSIKYRFDLYSNGTNTDPYKYLDMIVKDFNNQGIHMSYKKIDETYIKAKGSANKGKIIYGIELIKYGSFWCYEISIESPN